MNINWIECAGYYNEIGNQFNFSKKLIFDKLIYKYLNNSLIFISSFNILVIGRPGVGRSTLINSLIKSVSSKASIGEENSKKD